MRYVAQFSLTAVFALSSLSFAQAPGSTAGQTPQTTSQVPANVPVETPLPKTPDSDKPADDTKNATDTSKSAERAKSDTLLLLASLWIRTSRRAARTM